MSSGVTNSDLGNPVAIASSQIVRLIDPDL